MERNFRRFIRINVVESMLSGEERGGDGDEKKKIFMCDVKHKIILMFCKENDAVILHSWSTIKPR